MRTLRITNVLTRTSVEPELGSYSSSPSPVAHRTTCAVTKDIDKGAQLPRGPPWSIRTECGRRFTHVGTIQSLLQDGHRMFLRTDILDRLRPILFHPSYRIRRARQFGPQTVLAVCGKRKGDGD